MEAAWPASFNEGGCKLLGLGVGDAGRDSNVTRNAGRTNLHRTHGVSGFSGGSNSIPGWHARAEDFGIPALPAGVHVPDPGHHLCAHYAAIAAIRFERSRDYLELH